MQKKSAEFLKKQHEYDAKFDDLGNACSFAECTGLIQTPPLDRAEYDSYMTIFDFGPSGE